MYYKIVRLSAEKKDELTKLYDLISSYIWVSSDEFDGKVNMEEIENAKNEKK